VATDPLDPVDLDELERHVSEFNQLLLSSFWLFQSTAILSMIRELRHLREVVDEWSPIVAEYLVNELSEPAG
jgi:hypothetical protein